MLRNQQGSASIEVLLFIPVFFMMIVMLFSVSTTLMVKHATVVNARDIARVYAEGAENISFLVERMVGRDSGHFGKIVAIDTNKTESDTIKVTLKAEKTGFAKNVDNTLRKIFGSAMPDTFEYAIYFPDNRTEDGG